MEELIEAGNNNPQESLDEIGQSLNLTTRRVEQLKDRAIARLVENEKKITQNVSNAYGYWTIISQ